MLFLTYRILIIISRVPCATIVLWFLAVQCVQLARNRGS